MAQAERGGGVDQWRGAGIPPPRQNVQNNVGRMNALGQRLGAGGLDRRQTVGEHRGEDPRIKSEDKP